MSNPYVREIGHMTDDDQIPIWFGVDFGRVTTGTGTWASGAGQKLSHEQAEKFAHLFIAACWAAGRDEVEIEADFHG
jgi:hypothetical protein